MESTRTPAWSSLQARRVARQSKVMSLNSRAAALRAELSAIRATQAKPDDFLVLPDVISKEPLGPMVRHGDDQWFDIVKWTVFAMIEAEEKGITSDNVEQMIKATSDTELQITTDKAYAQSFFYNILTSVVSSIVDKKEVMAHEANGDLGYEWLKTHSAGSGPFMLRSWKPSDSIVLEAPEGDYWMGERAMKRVYVRHSSRMHPRGAARPHLQPRRQPEERGARQTAGYAGDQVPDRL